MTQTGHGKLLNKGWIKLNARQTCRSSTTFRRLQRQSQTRRGDQVKVRISDVRIVLAFAITASVLSGCAAYGDSAPGPYPARHHINIPERYMPPPGKCRIWFPDLPPSRQSPPRQLLPIGTAGSDACNFGTWLDLPNVEALIPIS